MSDRHVVACIDGSTHSAAVCDYAAWASKRLTKPLTLLHNIEPAYDPVVTDFSGLMELDGRETLLEELTSIEEQRSRLMLEQGKFILNAARQRAVFAGAVEPLTKQRHDGLTESLIELEDGIELVVLGIRGADHEKDNQHLGGHLESSIRAVHQPILVVNNTFKKPQKIMLAYDASEPCEKALNLLLTSTLLTKLPVHLVTSGQSRRVTKLSQREAQESLAAAGHEVVAVMVDGPVGESLHQYQRNNDIDLTLMGAFGHTRLREFVFGSVTVKILLSANRPLLLVR